MSKICKQRNIFPTNNIFINRLWAQSRNPSNISITINVFSLGVTASRWQLSVHTSESGVGRFSWNVFSTFKTKLPGFLYFQLVFRGSYISIYHYRWSFITSIHLLALLYQGVEVPNPYGFSLCGASSDCYAAFVRAARSRSASMTCTDQYTPKGSIPIALFLTNVC